MALAGMLWFDNSKDPLVTKIERALAYYAKKYGKTPGACYVHPAQLEPCQPAVELKANPSVPKNHLWICEATS